MTATTFTALSPDDLRAMIGDAVRDAMRDAVPATPLPPTEPPGPDYLTRAEAAALLRVSLPTLWAMGTRGDISPVRVPGVRRTLYRRAQVEALLSGKGSR